MFAHSPTEVKIDVSGHKVLNVKFGMRDGSWQGGTTAGVCFGAEISGSTPLFKRCLTPLTEEQDRGEHAASIELSEATQSVKLRTECVAACDWGWSYWSLIDAQ